MYDEHINLGITTSWLVCHVGYHSHTEHDKLVIRLSGMKGFNANEAQACKADGADNGAGVRRTKVQMSRMTFLNELIVVSVLWEEGLIALPKPLIGAHNE